MSLVLQVGDIEEIPEAPARMHRCGDFALTEREYLEAIGALQTTTPMPTGKYQLERTRVLYLCGAPFNLDNIEMYLRFLSFLNTVMAQVIEIIPHEAQGIV